MKNTIIVESKNDKQFFEAICKEISLNAEIEFVAFDDKEGQRGLSEETLKNSLQSAFLEVRKKPIGKIGIILVNTTKQNSITL